MNFENKCKQLFIDIIGQNNAISLLKSTIKKAHFAPAYLFTGPNGVGRKLTALRFLEGLLTGGVIGEKERKLLEDANHPDLLWIEPTYLHQGRLITQSIAQKENISRRSAPQIRLEQVRGIKKFLGQKPIKGNLGMVVIEEVESMNEAASNALLKTLEEPQNGILILISARPERLLKTIHSRCQTIPFNRLTSDDIQIVLDKNQKAKHTNFSHLIEQNELLSLANGSPGELFKHLEIAQEIPEVLWPLIKELPKEPIAALTLAREITDALEIEQQIWIIDWLQQYFWRKEINPKQIKILEALRVRLLSFVQPRLAWEVSFLELIPEN